MILQLQAYAKWQEEWILIDHTLFNIFRLFDIRFMNNYGKRKNLLSIRCYLKGILKNQIKKVKFGSGPCLDP